MRTRTITRSNVFSSGHSFREFNAASPTPPAWTVLQTTSNYSWNTRVGTIIDELHPALIGVSKFGPCTHTQAWISPRADCGPGAVLTADFPRYYGYLRVQSMGYMSRKLRSILTGGAASANVYSAGGWADFDLFASLAKEKMLPKLTDGDSLLSFIYELKDFRRLGSKLLNAANSVSHKLHQLKQTWEIPFWAAWGSNPWDSKPRKTAQGYLAWRFAWAPFVSDCKKILAKLLGIQKQIRGFIRRAKQQQQRYYGKTFPLTFPGGPNVADWSPNPSSSTKAQMYANVETGYFGVCTRREEYSNPTCRCHATMRYSYTLPASISSLDGRISSYLDVLGVNANPAIIWNAIPFSFVVDWFINVGGFLERLRVDNIRATTIVSQFCVSAKFERNFVTGFQPYAQRSASDTPVFFEENGVAVRCTRYERRVYNPETIGTWLDSGGGLTNDKASLLTALAYANTPQPRKRFVRGAYQALSTGTNPTTWLAAKWGADAQ